MSDAEAAAILATYGVIIGVSVIAGLIISAGIAYLFYINFTAIPEEHRQLEPNLCWLYVVPCVNIVMAFILIFFLNNSYKSYFNAQGKEMNPLVDQLALWWAITFVLSMIPYVGCCTAPVNLVLLILWFVKVFELRTIVQQETGQA